MRLFKTGNEHDYRENTSHYGEAGGPEASKWDSEVRKAETLSFQAQISGAGISAARSVEKIKMIQAGRRE